MNYYSAKQRKIQTADYSTKLQGYKLRNDSVKRTAFKPKALFMRAQTSEVFCGKKNIEKVMNLKVNQRFPY